MTDKNEPEVVTEWFPCPCCEDLTRYEKDYGSYEICDTCGWEDDNIQAEDADYEGGANRVSLNQARKNYLQCGYADPESKDLNDLLRWRKEQAGLKSGQES